MGDIEKDKRAMEILEKLIEREKVDFFNGDKREVFDRLISVETKLNNLCKNLDRLVSRLPCETHSEKISKNELKIEKSKFTLIMASLSIIVSIGSVVGVTIAFVQLAHTMGK